MMSEGICECPEALTCCLCVNVPVRLSITKIHIFKNQNVEKKTNNNNKKTELSSNNLLTVHCMFVSRQQFDQSPEGVFFVHVDEKQCCDLTHTLAVAHLLKHKQHKKQVHIRKIMGLTDWDIQNGPQIPFLA